MDNTNFTTTTDPLQAQVSNHQQPPPQLSLQQPQAPPPDGGPTDPTGRVLNTQPTSVMVRKKRGRPRKYEIELNNVVSMVSPTAQQAVSGSGSGEKRGRGRPRGSGKLQLLATLSESAAATAGGSFTPFVVTVHTGEDVVSRILSFSQRGTRSVCILSANGMVSRVALRQIGSSGGILSFQGMFEILNLCGSFTSTEMTDGTRNNTMFTISLSKPDGRVFGGAVAGTVIAASPIQLVIASFKQYTGKELKMRQSAESTTAASVRGNMSTPAKIAGDHENSTTPTSTLLEAIPSRDSGIRTQNITLDSRNGSGDIETILQSSQQTISDQLLSASFGSGLL